MTENLTIKKAVNKLQRLISNHVGSGGADIHPNATRYLSGFAAPKDVTRVFLANGTDILKVDDGHYYASQIVNGPLAESDGSVKLIDIFSSAEGRKDLVLKISADGREWQKSIHTNGTGGFGWVQTEGPVYAFSQTVSNFNGTGISGFIKIKVMSRGTSGTDVSIFLKLDNVTAIASNSGKVLHTFDSKVPAPPYGFSVLAHDWNVPGDRNRDVVILVTSTGISVVRPDGASSAGSYRASINFSI